MLPGPAVRSGGKRLRPRSPAGRALRAGGVVCCLGQGLPRSSPARQSPVAGSRRGSCSLPAFAADCGPACRAVHGSRDLPAGAVGRDACVLRVLEQSRAALRRRDVFAASSPWRAGPRAMLPGGVGGGQAEILTGLGLAVPAGSTCGTWPARWMANGGRWRSGSPGRDRRRACRSCPRRSAGSGLPAARLDAPGGPDSLKAAPRDGGGDAAAGRPAGRAACRCMPGPAAWMPAPMLPGPSSCAQDRSRSRRCWWPGHAAWG